MKIWIVIFWTVIWCGSTSGLPKF